jgi:hypothetical protein
VAYCGTEGRRQCDVSHFDAQTCCVRSSVGRRFYSSIFPRALGQLSGFRLSTGTSDLFGTIPTRSSPSFSSRSLLRPLDSLFSPTIAARSQPEHKSHPGFTRYPRLSDRSLVNRSTSPSALHPLPCRPAHIHLRAVQLAPLDLLPVIPRPNGIPHLDHNETTAFVKSALQLVLAVPDPRRSTSPTPPKLLPPRHKVLLARHLLPQRARQLHHHLHVCLHSKLINHPSVLRLLW